MSVLLAGLLLNIRTTSAQQPVSAAVDESAAYEAIAAELQRGASLRHAISAVYPNSRLSRLALSGQPMSWVAAELVRRSRIRDGFVGAGLQLAAASGAPATQLFLSLADRVRAERDIAVKKRVMTAQARASALVVALLPLIVGLLLVLTRSADVVTTSVAARTAVLVGMAMELAGGAIVVLLARRAGS